jgi:hypothetical protein
MKKKNNIKRDFIKKEYYNNSLKKKFSKKYFQIITINHFLCIEKFILSINLLKEFNEIIIEKIKYNILEIINNIKNNKLDDKLFFKQNIISGISNSRIYYNVLLSFLNNYSIKILPLFDNFFLKISFFVNKKNSLKKLIKYLNYIFFGKLFDNVIFDSYIELMKKYNIESFNGIKYKFYRPIVNYYIFMKFYKFFFIYNNLKISSEHIYIGDIKKINNKIRNKISNNKIYYILLNKEQYFLVSKRYKIIKIILKDEQIAQIPSFILIDFLKINYTNYYLNINKKQIISINFILNNFKQKSDLQYIKEEFTKNIITKINELLKYIKEDLQINHDNLQEIYKNTFFDVQQKTTFLNKNKLIFNISTNILNKKYNEKIMFFFDFYLFSKVIKHFKINKKSYITYLINKINFLSKEEKNILYHINCYDKCYKYTNYFQNKNNCLINNSDIFIFNIVKQLFDIFYLISIYPKINSSNDPLFVKRKIKNFINIYQKYLSKKKELIDLFSLIKLFNINKNIQITFYKQLIICLCSLNKQNILDIKNIFFFEMNNFKQIKYDDNDFYNFIIQNFNKIIFFFESIKTELFFTIIKRINGILKNQYDINKNEINKINTVLDIITKLKNKKDSFSVNFSKILKKYTIINSLKTFQFFLNNFIILLKYLFDNYTVNNNKDDFFYLKILLYIKKIFFFLFLIK